MAIQFRMVRFLKAEKETQ